MRDPISVSLTLRQLRQLPEYKDAPKCLKKSQKKKEDLRILLQNLRLLTDGGYRIDRHLGSGVFGDVFMVRGHSVWAAIKFFKSSPTNVERELAMMHAFDQVGIGVTMFRYDLFTGSVETSASVIMEKLDDTLEKFLQVDRTHQELESLVQALVGLTLSSYQANLMHGDLHVGNVGIEITNDRVTGKWVKQVRLLDFTHAQPIDQRVFKLEKYLTHEFGQFISVLGCTHWFPRVTETNRRSLLQVLCLHIQKIAPTLFRRLPPISNDVKKWNRVRRVWHQFPDYTGPLPPVPRSSVWLKPIDGGEGSTDDSTYYPDSTGATETE